MYEEMIRKIASIAMESMLYEVSATPKPGLVDRNNCGAHRDMDYFTFMTSAAALHNSFDEMVRIGWECREKELPELLQKLRESGQRAEKSMFQFTKGINTHKGMIFSLGILSGCAGWLLEKSRLTSVTVCNLAAELCSGICKRDFGNLQKKAHLTKGEKMYLTHGYKGIRGEAESGYQTVRQVALPMYRKMKESGYAVNETMVQTLLALIAYTEDTNIISRHDMSTAVYARDYAKRVLENGGICTGVGKELLLEMDEEFISNYISPGGAADLLAVTHFLYSLETNEMFQKSFISSSLVIKEKWRTFYDTTNYCVAVSCDSNRIRVREKN